MFNFFTIICWYTLTGFFCQNFQKLRADFGRETEQNPQKLRNTRFLKSLPLREIEKSQLFCYFYHLFLHFSSKWSKKFAIFEKICPFSSISVQKSAKIVNFLIIFFKNSEILMKLSKNLRKTEPKNSETEPKSPKTQKYKISHCFNKRQSGKKSLYL